MSTQRPHRSSRRGAPPPRSHVDTDDVEPLHPTLTPPEIASFHEWPLEPTVLAAIDAMGIVKPTPIQCLAIGPVLEGKDVIAKAETGTGKTLAFGAPMMAKIDAARSTVLGLVLTPTRELAEQVASVLRKLGEPRKIKVALVVGGEPMDAQIRALQAGAQVVVGTPGRVLDLYRQRFLSFPWTEFAVLDEADEMLEIGFLDDVEKILSFTPDERQTLLFSATFPPALLKLARKHTRKPAEVATAIGIKTVDNIAQTWMDVHDEDKPLALIRLIEQSEDKDVLLVFCDRREDVDRLMRRLERIRFNIKALHGGYDQAARFRVMSAFRTGEVKALIATDVASRGLDVSHVSHVVNFDVPRDITGYTHRIGRTGRAGRSGKAITFVSPDDQRRFRPIQKQATWDIEEEQLPGPSGHGRPAAPVAPPKRAPRAEPAPQAERAPRTERAPHAPRSEPAPRTHRKPAEHAPEREREHAPRAPARRAASESHTRAHRDEEAPRRPHAPASRSHAPAHAPRAHPPRPAPAREREEAPARRPAPHARPATRAHDDERAPRTTPRSAPPTRSRETAPAPRSREASPPPRAREASAPSRPRESSAPSRSREASAPPRRSHAADERAPAPASPRKRSTGGHGRDPR